MLTIAAIPVFTDNYIWCLHNGREAIAIDPGAAAPLQQYLYDNSLTLRALLITHHHPDHIGGVAGLAAEHAGLRVFGPDNPRIAGITDVLREGDRVALLNLEFTVLEVPGHTLDHIAFLASRPDHLLFCGDTLFAGGCGRLFEGSPEQMFASLRKLAALPPATRIYCTHEYTLSNLKFAHAVEPANAEIENRLHDVTALRAAGTITLPSTISLELATNPFLRSAEPAVRQAALAHAPEARTEAEIFAAIRRWKDQF